MSRTHRVTAAAASDMPTFPSRWQSRLRLLCMLWMILVTSVALSLSLSLLCTTVCQSNNHVAPRKFRIACIQLGHIAPRHRSVRRHVHKLEMPKRTPSLIFLTGFHSESENLGVLSDSSHEPIIRHCWHCCILRYERARQGRTRTGASLGARGRGV